MTLARTALRLLTVEAVKAATIAQARVYDSRVADMAPESFSEDARPCVIVYTDKDGGDAVSNQDGGPPFHREIELSFELGMVARIGDGDAAEVGYPETDAQLEAGLDFLEFQVVRRLAQDPGDLPAAWRQLARAWKYEGHRQVLDESGVKVACRVLTLTCETPDDDEPVFNADDPDVPLPTGLDVLPEPLRSVSALLPAGTAGRLICDQLAAALQPLTAPGLAGVDIQVDASTDDEGGSDVVDVTAEIQSALSIYENVASSNAIEIDYARGTSQRLILNATLDTITFKNWPRSGRTGRLILYVTNMGTFTIAANAWKPSSVWAAGVDYVPTSGAGKRDVIILSAGDGGAEFFGNVVGQDYS